MEEFEMEEFMVDEFVLDFDYEFDAPQYFDFSQPETFEETTETERWFESAASYHPSSFIPNSDWRYDIPEDGGSDNSDSRSVSSVGANTDASSRGLDFCNHMDQDIPKSKTKSVIKSLSRSSTLMKPTASYLAKQIQTQEVNSKQFLGRFQKLYGKMDKSQNSYLIENLATKRQKLEAGYLCKVSHLKHRAFTLHKVPNKAGDLGVIMVYARSKVTTPREPNLKTANRAQKHRSKVNAGSAEHAKTNAYTFQARHSNRKIFKSPASPLIKKSTLRLIESQEFQLRTSERARQHAHNSVATRHNYNSVSQNETKYSIRLNSVYAQKEEKCAVTQKAKSHHCKKLNKGEIGVLQKIKQGTIFPMEFDIPEDKTFLNQPPIELLQKLSLSSGHTNIKPQSKMRVPLKDSKESTQNSIHSEYKMMKTIKKNSQRFIQNNSPRTAENRYQGGKASTCRRITEVGGNINRSLAVR
ncbi:uncharacterized protein LOC123226166 [Mangifera indica]|uniref:uncharacterized protein LOC123226166 n=1 Tax=Mangifera indica TaxID=29780 RepID=UPI001CFB8A6C|nr:uncharacterized protein LOC123226166 [Mangifera indica]